MDYVLGILFFVVVLLLWVRLLVRRNIERITVFEYQAGLLYRRGKLIKIVAPGSYLILNKISHIEICDLRLQSFMLYSQEVLTTDRINLKLTLLVTYEIADPVRALNRVQEYSKMLESQLELVLRGLIVNRTLEQILTDRATLDEQLLALGVPVAEALGLRLQTFAVRDLRLPGKLKLAYEQILQAQQEGLAALEKARGETAALRHLANAAKLLENNPGLVQLRALQAIGEQRGNSVVLHLNPNLPATSSTPDSP